MKPIAVAAPLLPLSACAVVGAPAKVAGRVVSETIPPVTRHPATPDNLH